MTHQDSTAAQHKKDAKIASTSAMACSKFPCCTDMATSLSTKVHHNHNTLCTLHLMINCLVQLIVMATLGNTAIPSFFFFFTNVKYFFALSLHISTYENPKLAACEKNNRKDKPKNLPNGSPTLVCGTHLNDANLCAL